MAKFAEREAANQRAWEKRVAAGKKRNSNRKLIRAYQRASSAEDVYNAAKAYEKANPGRSITRAGSGDG